MSACVWSAFDNISTGPRWATIAPNRVIVILSLDPDGRWDAEFTDRDGGNATLRLGTSEEEALRDAAELAESI